MAVGAKDSGALLLRSPPFPGVDATLSRANSVPDGAASDPDRTDRLFATMREARVGGGFWRPPAEATPRDATLVRARSTGEFRSLCASRSDSLVRMDDVDPWSVLPGAFRLLAHGDDEWVSLAHIAGCPVEILSEGQFGAPGTSDDALRALAERALFAAAYRSPFTGDAQSIEQAVATLANWRHIFEANTGIVAACGMAWWKRHEIARFLWKAGQPLRFFRSERRAIAYAARRNGSVAVWPSRISPRLIEDARKKGVPLVRVEDGFVRSVGLGSNLVPPSSIAVDRLGIHYDPSQPSDLEALLAGAHFPPALLARAREVRRVILDAGISKYGGDSAHEFPARESGRRLVLVPGQVEDDMSVRLGGGGLASNLELLRRARTLEPDAEIWFRPHPDVDAGHRKGLVRDEDALLHADKVVRGGGMSRLLDLVDAVHVLTSLTGFEALMRGLDVTCYGTPFYAGWGLTRDLAPVSDRRGRMLDIDQLVAGVLILYPRYLDPVTGLPCPPETLIGRMSEGTARNRLGWITRIRQWQGRLMKRFA